MKRLLAFLLCMASVGGCGLLTHHVDIRSASLVRISADSFELRLILSRSDLARISNYQLHPPAILFGCANGFDFPVSLKLNGTRVDDADMTERYLATHRNVETVQVDGEVPAAIAAQMDSYCVRIEGGNMVGMRLRSDTVRVTQVDAPAAPTSGRDGPNRN